MSSRAQVKRDAADQPSTRLKFAFSSVVFLSAFLLFQVQLIIGKYILPRFGGSAAVWTTCLLLFQVLLLAGYAYAHLTRQLGEALRHRLHLGMLLFSVALLALLGMRWSSPITPGLAFLGPEPSHPVRAILLALSISVGLPFFLLSTTSPLLQDLYAHGLRGGSVYRLYALSNAGSLLGLLTYPFFVEPWITLQRQAWLWSAAYVLFGGGTAACLLLVPARVSGEIAENPKKRPDQPGDDPGMLQRAMWLLLAACGTALLLATTNYLCQDLAVVPLLWVLPLALYLLSFVLTFQSERLYGRWWAYPALAVATGLACHAIFRSGYIEVHTEIYILAFTQLAGCLVCHGELHRLKPSSRHLTSFYLTIAAGGALGTAFVALLAPLLFHAVWEFHLALAACVILAVTVLLMDSKDWWRRAPWRFPTATVALGLLPVYIAVTWPFELPGKLRYFCLGTMLACALLATWLFLTAPRSRTGSSRAWARFTLLVAPLLLCFFLVMDAFSVRGTLVLRERNFYGVLSVVEQDRGDPTRDSYELYHGRILHGLQLRAPSLRHRATTYYGNQTGIGLALHYQARRWEQSSLRVGVLGLGTGSLLIYATPGDYFRIYELNPAIAQLGQGTDPYFSYVRDCRGTADLVMGDARLSLQAEADHGQPQRFDVLVLDAFSGDSIPVHLLTREAFALYMKHLRDDRSIIAVHITNKVLDLSGVVAALARENGLHGLRVRTHGQGDFMQDTDWILLSRQSPVLKVPPIDADVEDLDTDTPAPVWTDDYSNIVALFK